MRSPFLLAGLFLLLFLIPVSAQSISVTPVSAEKISAFTSILPLPVTAPDSLAAISATEKTAESVFVREKQAYADSQSRLLSASAAEQPALRLQVSEQRYRLLISILNRVTVIYQRLDYMLDKMDAALLRVRVMYRQKGDTGIPDFDARVEKLQARLDALHSRSARTRIALENVKGTVNTLASLRAARDSVSDLLREFRPFLADYRDLARDVVRLSP